jgi:CheY-like chemotaxis protein
MELQLRASSSIPSEIHVQRKTILVVDDNQDLLEINKIFLEMAGYEVLTADSGGEAFRLLEQGESFDLILLDMQMGDMSGMEFLRILELNMPQVYGNVPIVFLTGMDQVPKSKARGFLRKPMDVNQLIENVRTFIN